MDFLEWRNEAFPSSESPPANEEQGLLSRGYDVSSIKKEIMKTALEAGWSYQPSMFMRWS